MGRQFAVDADQPLFWRFPRRGTAWGAVFCLLMFCGLGSIMGILVLFGMMMGTLPFLAVAGKDVGPIIGVGLELLFIAGLLGRQVWRAFRAKTQAARDSALNWFAFGVLVAASLALSLVILEREYPG